MITKKKLIEVALPLPEINDASAYDKMPGIGPHPKGIHYWWSRKPLPTARAVLFASVVDDPSSHPEKWPTDVAQNAERERLFDIIRRMMAKKLHDHPEVYAEARHEMLKHCDGRLPDVYDPFAGGGTIPLEANRLGCEAHAADLNPVAVLLNKCNLELAPRWSGQPPVNPKDRSRIGGIAAWRGTDGLAADVRYYGGLIGEETQRKIGASFPKASLPKNQGGGTVEVVAWIWARTVASPDPSVRGKHVPLVSTYRLSSKSGKEAWLAPIVNKAAGTYRFEVQTGAPENRAAVAAGTKRGRGSNFECILTGQPISEDYVRAEGLQNRLGMTLLAIVASKGRGRIYLPATDAQQAAAQVTAPPVESGEMPDNARWFSPPLVGLKTYTSVFTPRQLTAMVTLSDLVKETGDRVQRDAHAAGLSSVESRAYASTVTTFLALALDRCADFNNSLCSWSHGNQKVMHLFGLQAIPMIWSFAEANILSGHVGGWSTCSEYVADCISVITAGSTMRGHARQTDAAAGASDLGQILVSTDPPYYDNIGYAGLSDFFYFWLRRTIGDLHPDLFSTLMVPSMEELTAAPDRFDGSKERAKEHFERGFRKAFTALREKMDPSFPLTVYYAFKQDDEESGGETEVGSLGVDLTTGWETLLEALINSGFQVTATWPVRSEQKWRASAMGANSLASCIVLACRPRPLDAPQSDRRSFVAELKGDLLPALRHLQQGNIAPVDFAQAAIGPGMAIYSRYSRILQSNGRPLSVRAALSLINQTLTEVLSQYEDDFDADTRWAIAWFNENGFDDGEFDAANTLARAKNTGVRGMEQAGILVAKGGRVRLLRPDELPSGWDPATDTRLTVWEMSHHLLRVYFYEKAGDEATADLLRKLGSQADVARDLAYRLFKLCEDKKRSQEAQGYNALVLGWPEIARLAREKSAPRHQQPTLFGEE